MKPEIGNDHTQSEVATQDCSCTCSTSQKMESLKGTIDVKSSERPLKGTNDMKPRESNREVPDTEPQVILKFPWYTAREEWQDALRGGEYLATIEEFHEWLLRRVKDSTYCNETELGQIVDKFHEIFEGVL